MLKNIKYEDVNLKKYERICNGLSLIDEINNFVSSISTENYCGYRYANKIIDSVRKSIIENIEIINKHKNIQKEKALKYDMDRV